MKSFRCNITENNVTVFFIAKYIRDKFEMRTAFCMDLSEDKT